MILYITDRDSRNIGAEMHYKAISDICGSNQIVYVDFQKSKKNIAGYYYNLDCDSNIVIRKITKLLNLFKGYPKDLSEKRIRFIMSLIESNNIDLVFLEESMFGSLVEKIAIHYPNMRIICFYHDIAASLYETRSKRGSGYNLIYRKLHCKRVIEQEYITQQYCENWGFSERDNVFFTNRYGKPLNCIIPLSMQKHFLPERCYTEKSGSICKLLFLGYKYKPNIEGIRWFYKNVLTKLQDSVEVDIIGYGSEILRDEFVDKRVRVIGGVDSLEEYYLKTDIVIIPLFEGGGMKMKTLEALSYGKSILSTKEGLIGYWDDIPENLRNSLVYQSDNADEWVRIINKLANETLYKSYKDIENVFLEKFEYEKMKKAFRENIFKR